jgi:hypothetical protein
MKIWQAMLLIGTAGLIGGLFNAFFSDNGLVLWRAEQLPDGRRILRPGFPGNMLVGSVTALVLAGLYSPLGGVSVAGDGSDGKIAMTLSALAGALVSGLGGARLLTNEVDRRYEESARRSMGSALQTMTESKP